MNVASDLEGCLVIILQLLGHASNQREQHPKFYLSAFENGRAYRVYQDLPSLYLVMPPPKPFEVLQHIDSELIIPLEVLFVENFNVVCVEGNTYDCEDIVWDVVEKSMKQHYMHLSTQERYVDCMFAALLFGCIAL